MHKKLESYLTEISHYLAVGEGATDILEEIRSHILAKAEDKRGRVTAVALDKAIAQYGIPQQVAARYLEGQQIISPTFRRHLFRYTAILFTVHFLLSIIALVTGHQFLILPFFFIPRLDSLQALFYLPMTIVYDLGLVGIILYLVTQKNRDARLPWPRFIAWEKVPVEMRRPRLWVMGLWLLLFAGLIYLYVSQGSIFFYNINFGSFKPLLAGKAGRIYSLFFLNLISWELIGYAVRFLTRSRWVSVIKNVIMLIWLWLIWNIPLAADFKTTAGYDLKWLALALLLLLTLLIGLAFLFNLVMAVRKKVVPAT